MKDFPEYSVSLTTLLLFYTIYCMNHPFKAKDDEAACCFYLMFQTFDNQSLVSLMSFFYIHSL